MVSVISNISLTKADAISFFDLLENIKNKSLKVNLNLFLKNLLVHY